MVPIIKFRPYRDETRNILKGHYSLGYDLVSLRELTAQYSDNVQTASQFRTMEIKTHDNKMVLLINPTGATETLDMRVSPQFSYEPTVRKPTTADTWLLTDVTPEEFEAALRQNGESRLIDITPEGLIKAGIRIESAPAPTPHPSP